MVLTLLLINNFNYMLIFRHELFAIYINNNNKLKLEICSQRIISSYLWHCWRDLKVQLEGYFCGVCLQKKNNVSAEETPDSS